MLNRVYKKGNISGNLAGVLLLASPSLKDPNFERSIVLISSHSNTEGAMGFVMNRPMGKRLGQVDSSFAYTPFAEVPVYEGGPVNADRLIFVAWRWLDDDQAFKLYFAISQDTLKGLLAQQQDVHVRCFLGCTGWGEGQLEDELAQEAWLPTPVSRRAIQSPDEARLWLDMVAEIMPERFIPSSIPRDLSHN